MTNNVNHQAEALASAMWRSIYVKIREWLHPHHTAHEPGGGDAVKIPFWALVDVGWENLAVDDIPKWDGDFWRNVPNTGGGGKHQVHFALGLPALPPLAPGPTNITGAAQKIYAYQATTDDGSVAGTCSIGGFSFNVPCSRTNLPVGTEPLWDDGVTIIVTLTDYGSNGSHLSIDIAAG